MNDNTTQSTQKAPMNLIGVGTALGAAIVATDEYKAYRSAEQRVQNDAQARALLTQFQDAQQTVQLMRQIGNAAAEETAHLEELQIVVEANRTLTNYSSAEKRLIMLLRELNTFISERLDLDFAGLTKPKSGCCG